MVSNSTWLSPEEVNPRRIPLLIVMAETFPPCQYQRVVEDNSVKSQVSEFAVKLKSKLLYLMINVCPQRTNSIRRYYNSNFFFIYLCHLWNFLSYSI